MQPLDIPSDFMAVRYNGENFPGAPGFDGLDRGANCQVFAFAILAHFGLHLPALRSSELWEDQEFSRKVEGDFRELDLLLFHDRVEAYGAHVAVHVGRHSVLHLSARHGHPAVESIETMLGYPEYRVLIGAKRCLATSPLALPLGRENRARKDSNLRPTA